jgi:hypothetical protein
MTRTRGHSADADLVRLFDALAPILISLDITPSRLAQIARASFVKSSAKQARMKSSGRPHLARIAALTGLSRSEVKRLVVSGYKTEASSSENLPRALRVLDAWRTSNTYAPSGRPRCLRILGRQPSFDALCKSHSGDIPYKVILDELERSQRELMALNFATTFLQDALQDELVLVRRKQKIASSSALSDSYVETAIATRLNDLLDQLPELFANRKSLKRNIVNVFTLVSKNK